MAAAQRPLNLDELREALSVAPGNLEWDPSKLSNDIHKTVSRNCGSLAAVDEEDGSVTFVHPSIKQFLLNGAGTHTIALSAANLYLGQLCVTYLNFPVHETQLVKQKPKSRKLKATDIPLLVVSDLSSQLSQHPAVKTIAVRLLKASRGPKNEKIRADAFWGIDGRSTFLRSDQRSSYAFIEYATTHWPSHSRAFTPEMPSFDLLCRLLKGEVSFIQQPWNHTEIIEYDFAVRHPLLWAGAFGHEAAARLLIDHPEVEIDGRDGWGRTPLSWAANSGHESLVQLLLSTKKVDVESKNQLGWTPLIFAADHGNPSVIEILLTLGNANPNAQDHKGRTALALASLQGFAAAVRLLLDNRGVEADTRDRHGRTPLSLAAEYGHEKVVRMFLQRKDVEFASRDENRDTPYAWAVRGGHTIVACLLESKSR